MNPEKTIVENEQLEKEEQMQGYTYPNLSGMNEIYRVDGDRGMSWKSYHWEADHKKVYVMNTWVVSDGGDCIDHEFEIIDVLSNINQLPEYSASSH